MLVSFIISTKNNAYTIKPVIRSVCLAANQLLACNAHTELIVIDGLSNDGTYEKAYEEIEKCRNLFYDVKILRDPGISLPLSRKIGIEKFKGDIIILLDGDIILPRVFAQNLCTYLRNSYYWDAIEPLNIVFPSKDYSLVFNILINSIARRNTRVTFPRILKAEFVCGKPYWGLLSRYVFEDILLREQLRFKGARMKFSKELIVYKYDEPTLNAYWKKHYRYGKGLCKDLNRTAQAILLNEVILRRISYVDIFFPTLSLYTLVKFITLNSGFTKKDKLANSIKAFVLRYAIRLAMFLGDVKGCMQG